jgi:hypothetical protein
LPRPVDLVVGGAGGALLVAPHLLAPGPPVTARAEAEGLRKDPTPKGRTLYDLYIRYYTLKRERS